MALHERYSCHCACKEKSSKGVVQGFRVKCARRTVLKSSLRVLHCRVLGLGFFSVSASRGPDE